MERAQPKLNQESVWDYPRPPRVEDVPKFVQVVFNGVPLATTHRAKRVLETSHPPVYYIPPEDVWMEYLFETEKSSFCEFKGVAHYYTIKIYEREAIDAAWFFPYPNPGYEGIKNYIAFYPAKMEACYVDSERVKPQEGGFYGGWITRDIIGPFKGAPGTLGW